MKAPLRPFGHLAVLICIFCVPVGRADPVAALQSLRVSGCAGALPTLQPLHHDARLDRAAALWSAGGSTLAAAVRSGYRADSAVGLRLQGSDDAIVRVLRQTRCREIVQQSLRDIGVYRSGGQYWVLMASTPIPTPDATRVLEDVNAVRAAGTRCGNRSWAAAAPLQMSTTLSAAASGHAADMARHDYFEHVDRRGRSPADRVHDAGYRYRLVGENIAYGPASADEVVAGWLHSPGHCANIMDPRFVAMGVAYASGQGARHGLYWDQLLAAPAR